MAEVEGLRHVRVPGLEQQGYSAKPCSWPCHCSVVIDQEDGFGGFNVPAARGACIPRPSAHLGGGIRWATGASPQNHLTNAAERDAESPAQLEPKIARFSHRFVCAAKAGEHHDTAGTQSAARSTEVHLSYTQPSVFCIRPFSSASPALGHIRSAAAYAGGSMPVCLSTPNLPASRFHLLLCSGRRTSPVGAEQARGCKWEHVL